jgi:hypothetical protein
LKRRIYPKPYPLQEYAMNIISSLVLFIVRNFQIA